MRNLNDLQRQRVQLHAQEIFSALLDLLDDTQHKDHDCGTGECPVLVARKVARKVIGRRSPTTDGKP